ncbi:MAG: hypothetical protein IJ496_04665 [Ruminococcus sp.]|nr:hypothetical protein [Ruminococcus sp.]
MKSSNPPVLIDNYYESLAIHRTILEAKFAEAPENNCIAGSPFVADFALKLVDFLEKERPYEGWAEWRTGEVDSHWWNRALALARKDDCFRNESKEKQLWRAANYLSPFHYESDELELFLRLVLE